MAADNKVLYFSKELPPLLKVDIFREVLRSIYRGNRIFFPDRGG